VGKTGRGEGKREEQNREIERRGEIQRAQRLCALHLTIISVYIQLSRIEHPTLFIGKTSMN